MLVPSGLVIAIQLIALGLGFIVCYLAKREEKALKVTGYIIGVVIIALAGVLILNRLSWHAQYLGATKTGITMMQPRR